MGTKFSFQYVQNTPNISYSSPLKILHDAQKVPDLSEVLREGFKLQKRLDSSIREGRVLKKIEITINNYENIYMKIIDCNDLISSFLVIIFSSCQN